MEEYDHLVQIDEQQRRLSIYRVFQSGARSLYTCVDFPPETYDADQKAYEDFVRMLGENLIMDSPVARKLFDL